VLEAERNELLRRVDWRFLLHKREAPRALVFASSRLAEAVRLISDPVDPSGGAADLVVMTRPTVARLAAACDVLDATGELYCEWQVPTRGIRRAQLLLKRAGFTDITPMWPWPPPALRRPQFWLPLDSRIATEGFVSLRPAPASALQARARMLWPRAARRGLLAPVCVIARRSLVADVAGDHQDELGGLLQAIAQERADGPGSLSWVLLTGGGRTTSKIVGLPFGPRHEPPALVVKFARVPEADAALTREAQVLRSLAGRRTPTSGVPRVLAVGRRAGRVAIAQSAIHGVTLASQLTSDTYAKLALRVTGWLVALAGSSTPRPRTTWETRLVSRPLAEFEQGFRAAADGATFTRVRERLRALGALPLACEHRDCAPWNIVLAADGAPAALDWESAEVHGLPAVDLVYFLANAAFLVERTLDSGRTRETYSRLLDPATPVGRVADECIQKYCSQVGIDLQDIPALRVLCWVIHARSEYVRAEADAPGTPQPHVLGKSLFLGLIEEELQRRE
jgi:phosphotransferase family enzyme